ncbi:MAG: glycosyltransferase family 2 protein [Saprospiraceae bacterium]|nr:glycosyltransferase family 2 protein [Saprospiraceae bacterium]
MVSVWAFLVLGVYGLSLVYVTVYCLIQFDLLLHYLKKEPRSAQQDPQTNQAILPFVTIQLPLYNEKYVVERLLDAVAAMDYPTDRFEIHVLDDSTDETLEVVQAKVAHYRSKGIQIAQITRSDRTGYKAGALRDALPLAKGDFVAIFDADFLPDPGFLRQTLPHFQDPTTGVVQTRWEHLNEDYSLITQMQALQLNVHFTIEQTGRMKGGYLLQFNGTAGVWRKSCIADAGGWEADTLTEDLDLSIRAQLKGWKIVYLEGVGSPAELPAEMNSFRSQQFRWMKGGAETTLKMLPAIWSADLGWWKKLQATVHLLGSSVFLFVFLLGVSSVPLLFALDELSTLGFSKEKFAWFLTGLVSIGSIYFVGNVGASYPEERLGRRILRFLFRFPLFLSLSMGMALHNTVAILEGYRGKKSAFVRTPKFNIRGTADKLSANSYTRHRIAITSYLEALLSLCFLAAFIAGVAMGETTFLIFHAMLAFGYGFIFYFTIRHIRLK